MAVDASREGKKEGKKERKSISGANGKLATIYVHALGAIHTAIQ